FLPSQKVNCHRSPHSVRCITLSSGTSHRLILSSYVQGRSGHDRAVTSILARGPEEAGFCPVKRLRSTTVYDCQAGPREYCVGSFLSSSSSSHLALSAKPTPASSSLEKPVTR